VHCEPKCLREHRRVSHFPLHLHVVSRSVEVLKRAASLNDNRFALYAERFPNCTRSGCMKLGGKRWSCLVGEYRLIIP